MCPKPREQFYCPLKLLPLESLVHSNEQGLKSASIKRVVHVCQPQRCWVLPEARKALTLCATWKSFRPLSFVTSPEAGSSRVLQATLFPIWCESKFHLLNCGMEAEKGTAVCHWMQPRVLACSWSTVVLNWARNTIDATFLLRKRLFLTPKQRFPPYSNTTQYRD